MNTKKLVPVLLIALLPVLSFASGGGVELDHVRIDATDHPSLQRGAKTYMNYCLGCHTAEYQRYNRMAADIGLTEQQVTDNLIFTTDKAGDQTKIGSLIFNNMSEDYGKKVFGTNPPNLALVARSRGTDWLYTYLRTFHVDDSRPVGVNNEVFKDVGMPHALWKLQGLRKPVYETQKDDHGVEHEVITGYETIVEGTQSEEEYDQTVADLVNFLAYIADPIKVERHRIGIMVMLLLLVLLAVAIPLKKEYWKDIIK